MKTVWPQTLKARIVAILCSFFILSHVVSLVIYERNREKTVLLTEATDLAARIVGIVNLANSFPNHNRQEILAAAETQFLAMFPPAQFKAETDCQSNAFSERMSQFLTRAFTAQPNIDFEICLREFSKTTLLNPANNTPGLDVLVSINFTDSDPVVFHAVLPEDEPLLQDSVVIYLVVSGVATLLVAWYLIRKTVTPLERLARAADKIGVDIDAPPSNENAPTEIALATKAFNRMQGRLQQLIHGQTEMLAAISHDLRSAITRLQLRIELLDDATARAGLLRVAGDMRDMTQSVLDFVRGTSSNEETKNIDIGALVDSLCDDLSQEGYPVTFTGGETQHIVPGRPVALRRGFHNLIDNAVKYGTNADVRLQHHADGLSIIIADRGPGIPPEELPQVSKPFYRLEKSRNSATGGLGLGLSIAENIFHAHGAELLLRNGEQGGLVAEVRFSSMPVQETSHH